MLFFRDSASLPLLRQQQERVRRLEAAAEEERRQKQAEQQKQLQGLYRQQEEALRKKRPGGGSARRSSVGSNENVDQESTTRVPACDGAALSQATVSSYSSPGVIAAHQMPRRNNAGDIDDLPAGAQARAEILRTSPRGGDSGVSAPTPSLRPSPRESIPVLSPSPRTRFGGSSSRLAVDRGHNVDSMVGSRARMPAGSHRSSEYAPSKRELFQDSVIEEPQLRTHSSLMPVFNESLFPADHTVTNLHTSLDTSARSSLQTSALSMAWNEGTKGMHAGNRATSSANPYDDRRRDHRRKTVVDAFAPRSAAAPPQDEMDAFVTSWQTEHLRRRNSNHGLTSEREREGLFAPVISPRPPPSISPPRNPLRSSRARSSTSRRGGAWGPPPELEESLAATSRLVDLPRALPLPPTAAASSDRTKSPRCRPRSGLGGEDEVGDSIEACDRSLTSDSVLYYLTDQQQEG